MSSATPPIRSRRRWVWRIVGVLVILLIAAVVALPWWLGTPGARRLLLSKANAVLAPARVQVDAFEFAWWSPTRFRGVTLLDASGRPVLRSPMVVWDRSLSQIVQGGPLRGTFDAASLSLEVLRESDGDVTLAEALRPILNPKSKSDWTLRSREGRLRVVSSELKQPIDCRLNSIELRRPPPPGAFAWSLELSQDQGGGTLALNGHLANPGDLPKGAHPDLSAGVIAHEWPLDLTLAEGEGTARLSGKTQLALKQGLWSVGGESRLSALTVTPTARKQDGPVVLGDVTSRYDVSQDAVGWTIQTLDLDGALGTLRTESARVSARPEATITGEIDVARVASLFPDALPLGEGRRVLGGRLGLKVQTSRVAPPAPSTPAAAPTAGPPPPPAPASDLGPDGTPFRVVADLNLRDLRLADAEGREVLEVPPYQLAVTADLGRESGTIDLPAMALTGPSGRIEASGQLTGVPDSPRGDLKATLYPDWDSLRRELASRVDPDAVLSGGPLVVGVVGPLEAPHDINDLVKRWHVELNSTIEVADIYGMTLGSTPITARLGDGAIQIEPIVTVLNGGPFQLAPLVDLSSDGKVVVRLDDRTSLQDAEITEEVSTRFLTYLVPMVAQTARARGLISVQIDQARFPIDDLARADVRGLVVFRDAAFLPGPIANDVLDLLGNEGDRTVRLEKPVLLAITDGKVYQRDLSVRLGNVARFLVDGTVGFDQALDLVLRVPLQAERFQDVPVFNQIAPEIQVTIPVTGTIAEPKVDGQELARNMGRMGLNIAEGAVRGGLDALLQNALRPRTPEEQAAAEARRAERQARQEERRRLEQERREQRRMQRGR